jgi:hypothetical protein
MGNGVGEGGEFFKERGRRYKRGGENAECRMQCAK